jgi:hypothetical protein
MPASLIISLLLSSSLIAAHSGHTHGEADPNLSYAEQHVGCFQLHPDIIHSSVARIIFMLVFSSLPACDYNMCVLHSLHNVVFQYHPSVSSTAASMRSTDTRRCTRSTTSIRSTSNPSSSYTTSTTMGSGTKQRSAQCTGCITIACG